MLVITLDFYLSMTQPFQHLNSVVLNQATPNKNSLLPKVEISTQSPEEIQALSRAVGQWIEQEGWEFSCQTIRLSPEEMSSVDGLLPLVLRQAALCVGQVFGKMPERGVEHGASDVALCNVYVSALHDFSVAQWLLLSTYALEEHVRQNKPESGPVPIDALYEAWQQDLESQKIVVQPAVPGPSIRG